jgi:hypothetical protein
LVQAETTAPPPFTAIYVCLWLFKAEPDCWYGSSSGTFGSPALWTEHRHKRFIIIATDCTTNLYESKASLTSITFVALWPLRSWHALWPCRTLGTGFSLWPLGTGFSLWPGRTLGTGFSLWPGGTWHLLAPSERKGGGNHERHYDLLHFQIPRISLSEHQR